jgi:hypothetical protein
MQYIFGVSVISVLMEVPNRSLICTPLLLAALLSVHGRGEGNSDNMLDIQTCFFAFQINRFMNDLTLKFKAFALAQRRSLEQRLQMGPTAARKLCVWLWCRDELLKWLWLCGWEGAGGWSRCTNTKAPGQPTSQLASTQKACASLLVPLP